jgi:hypothetical protein
MVLMPDGFRVLIVLLLFSVALSLTYVNEPALAEVPAKPIADRYKRDTENLRLQWLGTSSWIISRGRDVVVVDPFFSRPPFIGGLLSSILGRLHYDEERIAAVLPALPEETSLVLIGHGHYDHIMDVPYYLRLWIQYGDTDKRKKMLIVGSTTAYNILLGFREPALAPVYDTLFWRADDHGYDKAPILRGNLVVTPFLSDHAPHVWGTEVLTGETKPLRSAPGNLSDYQRGNALNYFIDFYDDHHRIAYRVFINGAASRPAVMDHIGADFLKEHPVNIAILCVPGWNQVKSYPESVIEKLRPETVVLSHFDNFLAPYKDADDPNQGMDFIMLADYPGFLERLRVSFSGRIVETITGRGYCFGPTCDSLFHTIGQLDKKTGF